MASPRATPRGRPAAAPPQAVASERSPGSAVVLRLVGALIALAPATLLWSLIAGTRAALGWRHPVTIAAMVLVLGPPLAAAARIATLPSRAVRGSIANLAVAAAAAAVVLGAFEIAVRLLALDPYQRPVWRRMVGDRPSTPPDPRTGAYTLRPGARWAHQYSSNERGYFDAENSVRYALNSAGFRGGPFETRRRAGVARVAFLGDSFGFGEGVKDEDVVTVKLEAALASAKGCAVEVLNFSVPGYETADEAALLERTVLSYDADLVVVWYFLNDVQAAATMSYLGGNEPSIFFPVLRGASASARFIGARLEGRLRSTQLVEEYRREYVGGRGWERVLSGLGKMGEISRQRALPIALFVHPILHGLEGGYPFSAIHEQVTRAAREAGLRPFDLRDAFPGHDGEDLWVHPGDQHPNEIAHALAAAYAAPRVAGLLPGCGGPRVAGSAQGPVPAAAAGDRIQ